VTSRSPEEQRAIREDVFRWLDNLLFQGHYEFSRAQLLDYHYGDERIPLLDTGRGIRNPATFDATLTIMSGWKQNKYRDFHDDNGWITYSYQASDRGDNVKLIRAYELQEPLVYFRAVREGYYIGHWPVRIAVNDADKREVRFPLDEAFEFLGDPLTQTAEQKRYASRLAKQRLHQPIFRARVLHAYASACAICSLQHAELLDAAHIIPDSEESGVASVVNGLSLCKIHHAAYDRRLLGITPDYEVRIDNELLDEVDGPMLRHGLQEMHRRPLRLPRRPADYPDRDALALRYQEFAA
jgi:putative restriction endonuclease